MAGGGPGDRICIRCQCHSLTDAAVYPCVLSRLLCRDTLQGGGQGFHGSSTRCNSAPPLDIRVDVRLETGVSCEGRVLLL